MRQVNFFSYTLRKRHLMYLLIFTGLYLLSSALYLQSRVEAEEKSFKNHAIILANDVWALDQLAIKSYLQLAGKTGEFQSIDVAIPNNQGVSPYYRASFRDPGRIHAASRLDLDQGDARPDNL